MFSTTYFTSCCRHSWFEKSCLSSAGIHTAYLNFEGDFKMLWLSVMSWAADTALLDLLGFQRGFLPPSVHMLVKTLLEVQATLPQHLALQ